MIRILACLLLCLLATAGCQTTPKEVAFTDSDPNIMLEPEGENDADVLPLSLWSPIRRRINASYYFLVGEYERLGNNPNKARELFETAYNLDPNSVLAWKMIASQAATGNNEEALNQARKIVLLYPKSSELQALYGQLLLGGGSFDRAYKHYQNAIKLKPDNLEAYLGLIQLHRMRNELPKAIKVAEEMVQSNQSFAEGWAILAKLYLSNNQKKKALHPAQMAYDLQSHDAEKILIYALALELNNESSKAVSLYEILFRMNPTNEELIGRMVDLYRQLGSLEDALSLLDEVSSRKEAGPGIKMQKSFILWELKRFQEASKILDELSQTYPESDRLAYMAALGHERLENFEKALSKFASIPSSSQYYVHARYRSVNILRKQQKHDQALKLVKEVVDSKVERYSDFYSVGASIYSDQKEFKKAISLLSDGLEEHPENTEILFLIGVYQERDGNKEECIKIMREVLRRDPANSSAYNYLGYLFAESGQNLAEAEQLIKKALDLKPNDGFYLDSLGWVYYQKKQYEKALELLIEANKIVPDEGVILEHIGDVYRALDNMQTASQYYENALKGRVEEQDKLRIEKKLEEIRKKNS